MIFLFAAAEEGDGFGGFALLLPPEGGIGGPVVEREERGDGRDEQSCNYR